MVGSSQSNSTAGGQGQWRTILASKNDLLENLILYKITPVTLPHIQPVRLNFDATNPVIEQNLTVVGYSDDLAQDGDLLMEAAV